MAKSKTELERVQDQLRKQQEFIDECDAKGRYDGANGVDIRQSDYKALRQWEERLEQVMRRQHKPGRVYPSRKRVVKPLFGTVSYIVSL